ncbi:MAG: hypothetical protein Q4E65_09690 [Clostridia bacterium]|nr:hypothetical protein [Clostridia bacterium]
MKKHTLQNVVNNLINTSATRKNRKRSMSRLNIVLFVAVLILGGILMLLATYVPFIKEIETLSSFLILIGQAMISISATSLAFGWFGFITYAQEQLAAILSKDEVLRVLSKERKKELASALMYDLYLQGSESDDSKSLIALLDNTIPEILGSYYYSDYEVFVEISLHKTKKAQYIKKKIHKIFTLLPVVDGSSCQVKDLLYIRMMKINDDEITNQIQDVSLNINYETIDKDMFDIIPEDDNESDAEYEQLYKLKVKDERITTFAGSLRVDVNYVTYVPITDQLYTITLDKPCKHMMCHFIVNGDSIEVISRGYEFMSYGKKDLKQITRIQNGVTVRFLSWALPGDGVLISIKLK